MSAEASSHLPPPCRLAVLWIDWYAYHVARFEGLLSAPELAGRTRGIELVGGVGVHAGLRFREELPAHLPVETLLPGTGWREAGKLALSRLLWRRLDALDPEAVLIPGYYTLPAIAAALWARAHNRTSILMTESTAYDHVRSGWKEAAKSVLLRALFDAAVTGGTAHRRYLEELNFPSDRVGRFYDVVGNEHIARRSAELRARSERASGLPEQPYFLYVGRLAPEKNILGLLEAWLAYRSSGGSWPLLLVGDGPERAALEQIVEASSFSSEVHFAGHRGSADLPEFYAGAGCFVLPSTREPWGLVVNEAMAAGLPVLVSSRCGSSEDLVEPGVNGFVFDPEDRAALIAGLHRIGASDRNALERMGKASAERIAAYTPQNFGAEIAKLLGREKNTQTPAEIVPLSSAGSEVPR